MQQTSRIIYKELFSLKDIFNELYIKVNGILGTVGKSLVKRLATFTTQERNETIYITALLKSTRILKKVLEYWECISQSLQKQTSNIAGMNAQQLKKTRDEKG